MNAVRVVHVSVLSQTNDDKRGYLDPTFTEFDQNMCLLQGNFKSFLARCDPPSSSHSHDSGNGFSTGDKRVQCLDGVIGADLSRGHTPITTCARPDR